MTARPTARPIATPLARPVAGAEGQASTALLLDALPNPLIGFSMRKLRTAYTGAALRVRRSSDNTEQDFSFVGNAFDAASLLTFCGSGSGFVVTKYDQGTIGNNGNQSTTTNQPRIVNSGVFDVGPFFDGANDFLATAANIELKSEVTFAAWVNPVSVAVTAVVFSNATNGASLDFQVEVGRTSGKVSFLHNGAAVVGTSTGSITANAWSHIAVTRSGSAGAWTSRIYINGTLDSTFATSQNPNAGATAKATLGQVGVVALSFFNGNIFEPLLFATALDATAIARIYANGAPA